MAVPIEMPKPGVTVEECLLVRWLRRPGERVPAGEIVAEIETDKATFDVTAPAEGVILEQFFREGDLVPVYTNLCVIGEPGESVEEFRPAARVEAAPPAPMPEAAVEVRPAAATGTAPFSPRARRFAAEHQFEPVNVSGSGPGGRVLEADVRRAWELATPAAAGGIRERIARRMRESLAATAQYTLHSSADATAMLELRRRIKASRSAADINLNEMAAFAAVQALRQHPELNAEFIDGKLHRHAHINLGFACDTPRGLIVPVVKNCHELSLTELSQRMKELAQLALAGKLSPDDLTGGTFTVSNLGALGIESFTPILNPPQVALLGIDAIQLKPVRRNGQVEFIDAIGLSLTADHQVIDGAPGARYLLTVREAMENISALAGLGI
jgi:pyruvate dehydrogenase E2 component (dihydrolipoamide acetyltransferase)